MNIIIVSLQCVQDDFRTWWTYLVCSGCTRAFPSPVSRSETKISNSNNRHGTFGPSPITVSETENSCSTRNVTLPASIFRFRIWGSKFPVTRRCCITWFSRCSVDRFSDGVIGSGGTILSCKIRTPCYTYCENKLNLTTLSRLSLLWCKLGDDCTFQWWEPRQPLEYEN